MVQKLRNTDFYEIILILIILTGIISVSFADIMNNTVIHNTGKIIAEIMAQSGSARDIQASVDLVAAIGGIVHIPEGTWNFVNVGESWTEARVIVPAGVSLFGAPPERYPNGSVVEWKTVLVLPWDMPSNESIGDRTWFKIAGSSNPNKPSRFSDIKLVGYREFDPNATYYYRSVIVDSVINFRVDHCSFRNLGEGMMVLGHYDCGVIDHCYFVNTAGIPDPYASSTCGYGIAIYRDLYYETEWEPDISKILGKYNNFTVFIEDCYFSKWRHCTVGNWGAHYVFRHNIIEYNFGYIHIDTHPCWVEPGVPNRAVEIYENQIINTEPWGVDEAIQWCSGGGVCFNNTFNSKVFISFQGGGWDPSKGPYDVYIWNNSVGSAPIYGGTEGVNYFLYEPEWYTPYPYPHPLTSS